MKTDIVLCSVTMKDLTNYFRSRDGGNHNRRFAERLAREVNRDKEQSERLLPPGWHVILHPSRTSFVRKLPIEQRLVHERTN